MTKFFKKYFFIILILTLAGYSYFIEPNRLELNKYVVQDSVVNGIKGVKIVFASDFHVKPYGQKRLDMIVEKINAENPDLVLSVGDYVCGHTRHSTMPIENIAKTLSKVKAKYGFYTTLGNHDGWYGHDEIRKALEEQGIKVLDNENVKLNIDGKTLYIACVEDMMTGIPDLTQALKGTKQPVILLSHTPDIFPEVSEDVNLTLAGHTHGGQVRIPLLGSIFTASQYHDKYAKGWKQEYNHELLKVDASKPIKIQKDIKTLFVTRGIGVSILPFRFNCPPEINVIEFE